MYRPRYKMKRNYGYEWRDPFVGWIPMSAWSQIAGRRVVRKTLKVLGGGSGF